MSANSAHIIQWDFSFATLLLSSAGSDVKINKKEHRQTFLRTEEL